MHARTLATRRDHADGEEREPDEADDNDPGDRPVRDLRRREDICDEQRDREEVEQTVREDGAEERRARPGLPVRQVLAQYRDTRELAGAGGQHGVPEEADAERGEHLSERRQRLGEGLPDREVPRHTRTTTDKRLRMTPTTTQRQLTKSKAW